MKLDSVRELKKLLPGLLAERFSLTPAVRASMALARAASAAFHRPSYALGVAARKKSYILAVRLQHRALEGSEFVKAIREKAKGEVEVRYIGRVHAAASAPWYQSRQRPLLVGSSVGFASPRLLMAGTIGCFVRRGRSGRPMILSNNHVLADENRLKAGAPIFQPGTLDKGKEATDKIATLKAYVRLRSDRANVVDAAVAELISGLQFDAKLLRGLGILRGVRSAPLEIGDAVHKIGRTTGHRAGRVTAIELDNVVVGYDTADFTFNDQIEIEGVGSRAFSDQGDSGSVIVDSEFRAAALLFADADHGGSNGQGLTFSNEIGRVLKALKVQVIT